MRPSYLLCCYIALTVFCRAGQAANTFHVDPKVGSMTNSGSAGQPWRTLAEVVASKLDRIKGGDTLLLRNGYHGEVQLSGAYNDTVVTVRAAEGHIPKLGRLRVTQCGKWIFRRLEISPSLAPETARRRGAIVSLGSRRGGQPSSELTIEDCFIYSALDTSKWSAEDWSGRNRKSGKSSSGINLGINATKLVARNNYILNVATGINVAGPGSLVEGNVIRNFSIDGMRLMSDDIVAQYNVIRNNMNVDDNHDDGIQAFLYNKGTGTLRRITTRGNIVINRDDEDVPYQGPMQGIGYFDGPLIDFVIEKNVVLVDHWHGVSLYEGQNGQVLDNVAYSRWNTRRRPWVMLGTKKKLARDNIVKNNYAHSFNVGKFAKEAANNQKVSEAIFHERLRALEEEINEKFGRFHPVARLARVTNERPPKPSAASRKSEPVAAPRPGKARAQVAAPTPEEVTAAKAAAGKLRRAVINGARQGQQRTVYIDFAGHTARARLIAADPTGMTVRVQGMEVPIAWDKLSPRRFYGIAMKYTDDETALKAFCRGEGLEDVAAR